MSYVYVIAAEGSIIPCKVGVAEDPMKRARHLSCGSPVRLMALHAVKCADRREAQRVERALHQLVDHFPNLRLNGEWVAMQADDLIEILSNKADLFESVQQVRKNG